MVNYIAYVTYIRAGDSGFIDIHRGFQGDANDDGTVDGINLGILGGNFFDSGKDWSGADFNGDTNVNSIDMGILSGNYFNTLNESGMQMMMGAATTPTLSDEEFAQLVLFVRSVYDTLTADQIVQIESSLDALAPSPPAAPPGTPSRATPPQLSPSTTPPKSLSIPPFNHDPPWQRRGPENRASAITRSSPDRTRSVSEGTRAAPPPPTFLFANTVPTNYSINPTNQ